MRSDPYPRCDYVETECTDAEMDIDEFIEREREDFYRQWYVYIQEYESENEY